MKFTIKTLKSLLSPEVTVTKKDGEFRVNYSNGTEDTAYYTDCMEDAFLTGGIMKFEIQRKAGV